MLTLQLQIPESVAAEYYQAADLLRQRFPETPLPIDAKILMAFTLSRYDANDVCGHFDLALRVVKARQPAPLNPLPL